jgi:hypothetical protein
MPTLSELSYDLSRTVYVSFLEKKRLRIRVRRIRRVGFARASRLHVSGNPDTFLVNGLTAIDHKA